MTHRGRIAATLLLSLATLLAGCTDHRPKQRGVCWEARHEPVTEEHLRALLDAHVEWIVQTPFGWQKRYDSPELALVTGKGVMWGETDEGLEQTTRMARGLGIKTLLKPHVWLMERSDGKWRTHIEMKSEQDWRAWLDDYRTFILHYAELAERLGIEALCVGTELHRTAVEREDDWRRIIADVRVVYGGRLTYAANWYEEFEQVRFWDALDYIGIQAYFPVGESAGPTIEEMMRGWEPHLRRIDAVRRRYGKPVLFTEIGYRSVEDGPVRPWFWGDRPIERATGTGLRTQADAYTAFFRTFWHLDWFAGAYVWKWHPGLDGPVKNPGAGYTPQGKPALGVLSDWYGRTDL